MNIEQFTTAKSLLHQIEELKSYSSAIGNVLDTEDISTYGIADKLENIAYAIGNEAYKKVVRMLLDTVNNKIEELQNEFQKL